jgi:hypothetical protein
MRTNGVTVQNPNCRCLPNRPQTRNDLKTRVRILGFPTTGLARNNCRGGLRAVLDLSPESILVRTTLCGVDTSSYGLTAIQRVQPGEPVAGNPLGGFCEGGRAQERVLKTRPYPPRQL